MSDKIPDHKMPDGDENTADENTDDEITNDQITNDEITNDQITTSADDAADRRERLGVSAGRIVHGWPTRWGAGALIAVLVAALGFAIVVQVHANAKSDNLSSLSASDLIVILDDQDARAQRLNQQISQLQAKLRSLQDSGNGAAAAQQQAQQDEQTLGILLGTLPAAGPGVVVTIADPQHKLQAEQLLDVIEELRGAGAEAIQYGPVRISTNSAFREVDGKVVVDGTTLEPPYQVLAIGESATLSTALTIPGGVASVLRAAGGTLSVTGNPHITITAVRGLPPSSQLTPSGH